MLAEANHSQGIPIALDVVGVEQLARNLVGLTEEGAMRTLRKCLLTGGKADAGLLDAVLDAKRDALHTEGLLESVRCDVSTCGRVRTKASTRVGRQETKRIDAGRTTIWPCSAKGRAHHWRSGLREEPRSTRRGWGIGHGSGAAGRGRTV